MKRINVRFLLLFIATLAVLAGGIAALNWYQVNRNAGSLAKMARMRLEEGRKAEAINLFGRYLGMRPQDAAVHKEFASLVLERALAPDATQADVARAYNRLEEAVRRNPKDDDLRLKLADFQLRIGRFADAREHIDLLKSHLPANPPAPPADADASAAATENPDDNKLVLDAPTLQFMLARSHAGTNEFEISARLAAELVAYDLDRASFIADRKPVDNADAYILLASILQDRMQDRAAADAILNELVERHGDEPEAWLAMVKWRRNLGDLDAASRDLAKAVSLAPDRQDVVFTGLDLAIAKQDFAGASKIADKARELFPDDSRAYRGIAALELQRGDLAAAEASISEGLSRLPNDVGLLVMQADVLLQQNKLADTEQAITRLAEISGSSNPAVGLLEGRLLIARGRWPQARQKLEQVRPLAVGLDALMRQIDLCLGQCYENLEEFDSQLDINRRILVEDPNSLAARVGAAVALAAGGRPEEAIRELEAVAAAIPASKLATIPQVWYPLLQMRVMEQLKRPVTERDWSQIDGLVDLLQESTAVSANRIALLRADILSRKGESEAAGDLLERTFAADPADMQLLSALATWTLRTKGIEAATAVLERAAPKDEAARKDLLPIEAQIAARQPPEKAKQSLVELEKRVKSLEKKEEGAPVLAALAFTWLGLGDPKEAERLLRESAAMQPDDLRTRTALLELAMAAEDLDKARAAAAEVEVVDGKGSARSLVAQAGVQILAARKLRQQKPADAQAELSPEETAALTEARNLLIEAENARPGWYAIQRYFAEIDMFKGDSSAAIERLQRALKLGPANPEVVRQLVALLYSTNRLDEARQTLNLLGPDGLSGFERVSAELELRSGKLDEAVALAERSVSKDSSDASELLWLGQLLERSNKPERAGEVFERAVELAPERSDVWLSLFAHQLAVGKKRAAEKTLDKAATTLAEPQRQLALAQGYEMLGKIDDAERAFLDASQVAPKDLAIARSRADFLVRNGRPRAAEESLRQLVTDTADNADSPAIRAARPWARRKLAELITTRGTYRSLEEALSLIRQNAAPDGTLPPEDAVLEISLLVNRPEPASWMRAINTLERLRDSQPLSTAQRLTLAGLLERVGRWNECRDEIMSIVSAPNTPPSFIGMLVEKLIDHDELQNAQAWFRKLKDVAPSSPIATALEARLGVASADRDNAAKAARRLVPEGPVPPERAGQTILIAKLLENMGFHEDADEALAKVAGVSSEGLIARVEFLGRRKRAAESLDLLEGAWSKLPLEKVLAAGLGVARAQGTADGAVARLDDWFAKALRVDPGSVTIPLLEADFRGLQGRDAEVETIYRGLLDRKDLEPFQKAIVANNLAFHLAKPATASEARKLIDSAIGTLGPHPDLLDTRGMVHLALGENREAVADFNQAVMQPSEVKYLHLAYARLKNGEEREAREALERARKKGLTADRLSADDRTRLGELEKVLGAAPEQAAADAPAKSRS